MMELSQELKAAIETTNSFHCKRFDIKTRLCRLDSCVYFDDCHKNKLNIKGDELK